MEKSESNQGSVKLSALPTSTTKPSLSSNEGEQLTVTASTPGPVKSVTATPVLDTEDDDDDLLKLPNDQPLAQLDYLQPGTDLQTIIKAIVANMLIAIADLIRHRARLQNFKGGRELLLEKLRDKNIPQLDKNVESIRDVIKSHKEQMFMIADQKIELQKQTETLELESSSKEASKQTANAVAQRSQRKQEITEKLADLDVQLQGHRDNINRMDATIDKLHARRAGLVGVVNTLKVGYFQARAIPNMEALGKVRSHTVEAYKAMTHVDNTFKNTRAMLAKSVSRIEAELGKEKAMTSPNDWLVKLLDENFSTERLNQALKDPKTEWKKDVLERLRSLEKIVNANSNVKIDLTGTLEKLTAINSKIVALRTDGTEGSVYESQSLYRQLTSNDIPTRQEEHRLMMQIRSEEQIPDVKVPAKASSAAAPTPKPSSTADDRIVVESAQAHDLKEVEDDYSQQQNNGNPPQGHEKDTKILSPMARMSLAKIHATKSLSEVPDNNLDTVKPDQNEQVSKKSGFSPKK